MEGDDDDDEPESLQEVITAIAFTDRNSLGCAYYVAREKRLYLMEDMQLAEPVTLDSRQNRSVGTPISMRKLTR